jgi:hypothetical protein
LATGSVEIEAAMNAAKNFILICERMDMVVISVFARMRVARGAAKLA